MTEYDPAAWTLFAGSMVTAIASLTGLLFVAISINLREILAEPGLPDRAFQSLALLVGLVLISTIVLFPGLDPNGLAVVLVVFGLAMGVFITLIHRVATRNVADAYRRNYHLGTVMSAAPGALLVLAGITLAVHGPGGMIWYGAADLAGILVAALNSWILLVEIHR